jgi:ParB family chromosome partitioning protein
MSRADQLLKHFGTTAAANLSARAKDVGVTPGVRLQTITLDRIKPDPANPRRTMEETAVEEMAESLRTCGLLQPIRARWSVADDAWLIATGHTRVAAARKIGWDKIDAITYPDGTPLENIRRDQIVENQVRTNVDPIQTASALRDLMDAWKCSADELSARVGVHRSTVSRLLALLKLDADTQNQVAAGEIKLREAVVRKPRRGKGRKPRSVEHVIKLSRNQRVVVVCGPDDDVDAILDQAKQHRQHRDAA